MTGVEIAVGATHLPVELTTTEAASFLGRSVRTVCAQCQQGLLPTMPGRQNKSSYRVPTARLLEMLGIAFEIVPVGGSGSPEPGAPPRAGWPYEEEP
ncbi:MAG TPA: helix-turn-helix domain-containing protein [Mycobacteriales bacterium]